MYKEKGKVIAIGALQTGTSSNGNEWARQQIVIEIEGPNGYKRKMALDAGSKLVPDIQTLRLDDEVEVEFQIYSREWNGRFYNNVDLFSVNIIAPEEEPQPTSNGTPGPKEEGNDLPF